MSKDDGTHGNAEYRPQTRIAISPVPACRGNGAHQVAVVSFDITPHLVQGFTSNTDDAAATVSDLQPGDAKVAILDAIKYAVDLLRNQPAGYRRAVVLLSETIDGRSQATLEDSVRDLNDTNTGIYAFGFSSAKAAVSHEATKPKRPGGSSYHGDVYAAGGCIRGTASCAFSVVPDGTGFWAEIQFPGVRPGLLSVKLVQIRFCRGRGRNRRSLHFATLRSG